MEPQEDEKVPVPDNNPDAGTEQAKAPEPPAPPPPPPDAPPVGVKHYAIEYDVVIGNKVVDTHTVNVQAANEQAAFDGALAILIAARKAIDEKGVPGEPVPEFRYNGRFTVK